MEKYAAEVKVFLTGLLAFGTALWGWFGWLVILLAIAMLVDYLTGSRVALKNQEWKSEVAREGRQRKLMTVVVIGCAGALDVVLGLMINNIPAISLPFEYTVLFCPIVVVWYLFTEIGSILENAVAAKANVPAPLLAVVKGLKASAGDVLDKAAGGGKEGGDENQKSNGA